MVLAVVAQRADKSKQSANWEMMFHCLSQMLKQILYYFFFLFKQSCLYWGSLQSKDCFVFIL